MRPASSLFTFGWLTNSENIVLDGEETMAKNCYERLAGSKSLLLHILFPLFEQLPCRLLGELQILVKSCWAGLVLTYEPKWVSSRSLSTLAAISVMEVLALKCL
jgi:hypothetical protein